MDDNKKIFDKYGKENLMFNQAPEDEVTKEKEPEEEMVCTIDPITGEEVCVPKEKVQNPGDDEDEEEISLSFSKAISNRKEAFNKDAKVHYSKFEEISDEIRDKLRELESIVNDPSLSPMAVDNGSTIKLRDLIRPVVAQVYSVLGSIPTSSLNSNEVNREGSKLLQEVKIVLSEIVNANSTSDRFALIMSIRSLYLNLFSTNMMLRGEPNLVNSAIQGEQTDLWRTFQLFSDASHEMSTEAAKSRNEVGDNAIEPDVTIVKPTFLLFPSQELKRSLMGLNISSSLIGDYEDDNDLGILGHFSVPTDFLGNGASDMTPEEEDRSVEGLFTINGADNAKPTLNAPNFKWSHNGTKNLRSTAPESYRRVNDAFVAEISALHTKATAYHIRELNIDIAFSLVLTGWLNAAFKVLVETNFNGTIEEVDKGIKFDADRMLPLNNDGMLFRILSGINLDKSNVSGDVPLFKSVFSMPKRFMEELMGKTLGGKFHYSPVAYKFLHDDFKAMTFRLPSELEYYIGNNKAGDHLIKVVVAPKLYLPVDITVDPDVDIEVEIPRPRDTKPGVVKNIFSFNIYSAKTHYVASRNADENDYIFNQSIFHAIQSLDRKTYQSYLDRFFDNNTFIAGNSIEEKSLATLFGRVNKTFNGVGYTRLFSSIAPFYNKNKILGLTRTYNQSAKANNNRIQYPIMDESFFYDGANNIKVSGSNDYGTFGLSDYIRSIFNFHGDWSWIEAAIVASMIMTGYVSTPTKPVFNSNNPVPYEKLSYSFQSTPDHILLSTVLRRARAYMDSDRYKFGFTRFNNKIIDDIYPTSSKRITKADILKAFRFSKYDRTDAFIIDNNYKHDFASRKHWFEITDGQLSSIHYLLKEDTAVNITEANLMSEIVKENFEGNFLIYDDLSVNKLNLTPQIIPATPLVGYKLSSVAARNRILQDFITDAKVYTKLGLNEFTYISDDFYPTHIVYTVTIPTNTTHLEVAVPESLRTYKWDNGKTDATTNLPQVNNIKYFDVALQVAHRTGMSAGNPQGFRTMLQLAFNINSNIVTRDLTRDEDTYDTGTTDNGEGMNYDGNIRYLDILGDNPAENMSFVSSFRYPQTVTVRAHGQITGLPKHISEGSALKDSSYWSIAKANSFMNKLGASVETNRTEAQVQHLTFQKEKLSFFELRQGLNNEYTSGEFNLAIMLPARTIIYKILGMEDKK